MENKSNPNSIIQDSPNNTDISTSPSTNVITDDIKTIPQETISSEKTIDSSLNSTSTPSTSIELDTVDKLTNVDSETNNLTAIKNNVQQEPPEESTAVTPTLDTSVENPDLKVQCCDNTDEKIELDIEAADIETSTNFSDEDNTANASTEVLLDVSLSERLAALSVGSCDDNVGQEDTPKADTDTPKTSTSLNLSEKEHKSSPNEVSACLGETKLDKSAELSRSIAAGEISDNSECSVDVDEEDAIGSDKQDSGDVSDEEMFIEDQDEDVEEEEEFHEAEEEKHKTSQENVETGEKLKTATSEKDKSSNDNINNKSSSKINAHSDSKSLQKGETKPEKPNETRNTQSAPQKDTDWADIMLSNIQVPKDQEEKSTDKTDVKPPVNADEEGLEELKSTQDDEKKIIDDKAEKKELDLDEDVKNPQYIPKKGVFYEHDDRSQDVNTKKLSSTTSTTKDDENTEAVDSSNGKKSTTQEKQNDNRRGGRKQRIDSDRWNHDLFRDEKQKPKSKNELVNSYGYDIRHERSSRNQHATDSRLQKGITNADRQQKQPQENQRLRQNRDNRSSRQNQPQQNRTNDRRPRRPTNRNRTDLPLGIPTKRDPQGGKPIKPSEGIEIKHDIGTDVKQNLQQQVSPALPPIRREQHQDGSGIVREKNIRNDNRGRRQNSKDRPHSNSVVVDNLPPLNTVMPPITTWSNKIEDMVREEANRKELSPLRHHQQQNIQSLNNNPKGRSNDYWPQSQQNKNIYYDRSVRNSDDNQRHQSYNNRRPYQDREDPHKQSQFVNKNHYNDRSNQHHQDWRRGNPYNSSYAKSNEYEPIKTQTFENSRLSQNSSMNRSNFRDARELINERRLQNQQQNYQTKLQPGSSNSEQHQHRQLHHQHQQQHLVQQQLMQQHHQQLIQQHQQAAQHMRHQPQAPPPQQQQQPPPTSQSQPQQSQTASQQQLPAQSQVLSQRQQSTTQNQHPTQQRQNLILNNMNADSTIQETARLNGPSTTSANDLINSRPIIKTDPYTGANVAAPQHSQTSQLQQQQHSQNHRSLGGPMSQQQAGPGAAGSHLVPSHLNAGGTQAQYYSSSGNSRDSAAAAAALATAYHGYIPTGHSVMDATRYHMTSQQLSDHGYMTSPGQTNDVAAASVLHQQGMYTDAASAGGTVASSAYLAQAGSTLSPSNNIPVTGAGPPLAPVSYLQHSQYPPPPYSNPYSQPQHNQAPPQSSHAYPYWTYI